MRLNAINLGINSLNVVRGGGGAGVFNPAVLWPLGASSPGMWIDPPYTASMYQDSAGTTALSAIGTVLDTSNPVGLMLDRKGGATSPAGPGIHLSQATSAARPVASARSNLLTYSEALDNAAWTKGSVTVTETTAISPIGTATADRIVASGTGWAVYSTVALVSGTTYTISVYAKSATGSSQTFKLYGNNGGGGAVSGVLTATSAWQLFSFSFTAGAGTLHGLLQDGTLADLYIWGAQLNLGSTALPYQRVNTAADYDASAGPTYLQFDGVDDALSSVPFAAGTLTSSMDCLIAVRRDSAAATYLISDTVSRGFFEWESGDTNRPDVGAGTPTYLVDGAAITATRGALFTALTAGSWHILEVRGLDLTTWTALGVSSFVSYRLNGALGEIQLFASGQDANRDKARAQMAAYFGVTLP